MLVWCIISLCIAGALGSCPDQAPGLLPFSGLGLSLTKSSDVSITQSILLDQNLDVSYITVSGNGKLVFKRGQDIVVKTLGIMVKDSASLIIGNNSCRHEDKVDIILQGERNTSIPQVNEGQKYIAVKDNGILQIHGADKLHWTKLSSTVERFDANPANVVFSHRASSNYIVNPVADGPTVYIIDGTTFTLKAYEDWDFYEPGNVPEEDDQISQFNTQINSAVNGDIVAVVIQDRFGVSGSTNLDSALNTLELKAGLAQNALLLRNAESFDAFAIVFVVGSSNIDQQIDYQIGKKETKAVASIIHGGNKISSESFIVADDKLASEIDLRIVPVSVGNPVISVTHDISSWNIGDEIVLTSTDFNYTHAEVRRIVTKPTSNTIQLDHELIYNHNGVVEERVDMRGEVALLTRNIKIQGEMSRGCPTGNGNCNDVPFDSFGGHIKIMNGFGAVAIQGAELQFMGQATALGFYPIYFHMCLDVSPKESIVKRNSIRNTYSRAITVQGTYGLDKSNLGVSLIENVAYDIFGSAYFLEDGAERATKLEGNLGANIKNIVNGFAADTEKATVFWITNPKVIMENNVAAGADGFCIWYIFPLQPVGPSASNPVYQSEEVRHTPMWNFDTNVVHSCLKGGLNHDGELVDASGNTNDFDSKYRPVSDVFDPTSDPVKVQITRLTAYKNFEFNVWIRGGHFELMQLSCAESQKCLMSPNGSPQQIFTKKSIMIGKSTVNHEDIGYRGAKFVDHYQGTSFFSGPSYVFDSSFFGFGSCGNGYVGGAVGFKPLEDGQTSPRFSLQDVRFGFADASGGNRVFDGDLSDSNFGFGEQPGDKFSTFRDVGGSISRCPGQNTWNDPIQIVKPIKFAVTNRCRYRSNWKMVACNDYYGKLRPSVEQVFSGSVSSFTDKTQARRVKFGNANDVEYEETTSEEYLVLLQDDATREYYYDVQYDNTPSLPNRTRFYAMGLETEHGVVFGFCLPSGISRSDFTLKSQPHAGTTFLDGHMQSVNSIQAVSSARTMDTYYLNGRWLYMKVQTTIQRDLDWKAYDTDDCIGGVCPYFEVTLNQNFPYSPCFSVPPGALNPVPINQLGIPEMTCGLPASSPLYDADWGAGLWKANQDGAWGEWSDWEDCCDGQNTSRYRVCDNPPPYGSGLQCAGPAVETMACTTQC